MKAWATDTSMPAAVFLLMPAAAERSRECSDQKSMPIAVSGGHDHQLKEEA